MMAMDINELIRQMRQEIGSTIRSELEKRMEPRGGRLMSLKEVADEYGMTVSFWRKMIRERKLPFVKVGGAVRIKRSDITAWIDENTIDENES